MRWHGAQYESITPPQDSFASSELNSTWRGLCLARLGCDPQGRACLHLLHQCLESFLFKSITCSCSCFSFRIDLRNDSLASMSFSASDERDRERGRKKKNNKKKKKAKKKATWRAHKFASRILCSTDACRTGSFKTLGGLRRQAWRCGCCILQLNKGC